MDNILIEILDVFSLVSILCGIMVIISKNPIVSVLFLIGLFLSIASYLIVLGVNFIGLSYLLVYVGAVSILFLFILMLINVRVSELSSYTSNSIPLGMIITVAFNFAVYQTLPYSIVNLRYHILNVINKINDFFFTGNGYNIKKSLGYSTGGDLEEIFFVTSNIWDGNLADTSHISAIGNIMYTNYSIWLILTSIILLLAMVGAITITIKQKVN